MMCSTKLGLISFFELLLFTRDTECMNYVDMFESICANEKKSAAPLCDEHISDITATEGGEAGDQHFYIFLSICNVITDFT